MLGGQGGFERCILYGANPSRPSKVQEHGQEHCYAFRGMLNGYNEAMRVFIKLLKLPFSILRSHGNLSAVFVDESYLQGRTFSTCEDNVNTTVDLLQSLGFTVHPEKSLLVPTQEIEFLGFALNSVEVKIKQTD